MRSATCVRSGAAAIPLPSSAHRKSSIGWKARFPATTRRSAGERCAGRQVGPLYRAARHDRRHAPPAQLCPGGAARPVTRGSQGVLCHRGGCRHRQPGGGHCGVLATLTEADCKRIPAYTGPIARSSNTPPPLHRRRCRGYRNFFRSLAFRSCFGLPLTIRDVVTHHALFLLDQQPSPIGDNARLRRDLSHAVYPGGTGAQHDA